MPKCEVHLVVMGCDVHASHLVSSGNQDGKFNNLVGSCIFMIYVNV